MEQATDASGQPDGDSESRKRSTCLGEGVLSRCIYEPTSTRVHLSFSANSVFPLQGTMQGTLQGNSEKRIFIDRSPNVRLVKGLLYHAPHRKPIGPLQIFRRPLNP